MTDMDIQRRRDGAFFEDWSPWRDLGSPPHYYQGSRGRKYRAGNHVPSYHCLLLRRLPSCDGPGFEIAVPSSIVLARLLQSAGGVDLKMRSGAMVDTWLVPAEHWEALRKILPIIRTKIAERKHRNA